MPKMTYMRARTIIWNAAHYISDDVRAAATYILDDRYADLVDVCQATNVYRASFVRSQHNVITL